MNIKLYKTSDDSRVMPKTLTNLKDYNGFLREQTSVMTPKITIESTDNLAGYNYAYVTEFGRYYYITDIKPGPNNLWEIDMSIDVLMTYKDQLKNVDVIISRNRDVGSSYIGDDVMVTSERKYIYTKEFPNAFSTQPEYVLVLSGSRDPSNAVDPTA